MNADYSLVSARARHVCEYCRAPEAVFNLAFEVKHLAPQSSGGKTVEENLALSCRSCNLYRFDFMTAFDEQTKSETRLINPRRDVWREHYIFNAENGEIIGLTAIGRATIVRLRINSNAQTAARRQWSRLGFTF